MLSKALIFVFSVLGIYGLIMATMPAEFLALRFSGSQMSVVVKERFSVADILVYSNTGTDNMTYPYTSLSYTPPRWQAGLPTDHYLEVWWSTYPLPHIDKCIALNHVWKGLWFWLYGWDIEGLVLYPYGSTTPVDTWQNRFITREIMVENWVASKNGSAFTARGSITANILFTPTDPSKTIGEAFDDSTVSYYLSYAPDMNQTGLNAWTIVSQLLTFQAPDFGIGGVAGLLLNGIIAIPIWSMIAYLIYKIVAGVIPLISGGSGD